MAFTAHIDLGSVVALGADLDRFVGVLAAAQLEETRQTLREAKRYARQEVLVDEGDLEQSIRFTSRREAHQVIGLLLAGAFAGRNKFVSYHWYVEMGTRYTPPQPFMRVAFMKVKAAHLQRTQAVTTAIVRLYNGLG